MQKHIVSWLGAALLLAGAAPASATVFDITYTGTVVPGAVDANGLFGPAGDSVGGAAFTAIFVYDETLGFQIFEHPASGGPSAGRFGDGPHAVFDSVSLAINGRTHLMPMGFTAQEFGYHGGTIVLSNLQTAAEGMQVDFLLRDAPPYPVAPFSGVAVGQLVSLFSMANSPDIYLTVSGMTVEVDPTLVSTGPIPEPASWSLMLLGVSGLGAALRRARSGRATG